LILVVISSALSFAIPVSSIWQVASLSLVARPHHILDQLNAAVA
jgi:hypothetical protein